MRRTVDRSQIRKQQPMGEQRMFTGIIEEMGQIVEMKRHGNAMTLAISCRDTLTGMKIGDSIAVNGICLTVTAFDDYAFTADVMVETMNRTNLSQARVGDRVNLERSLLANDRVGGHFVTGHIDGTAQVAARREIENAVLYEFGASPELTVYMVPKGSVAVNGISLTLVDVADDRFSVAIIPHTMRVTNMGGLDIGGTVNVECDVLGKYVIKAGQRYFAGLGTHEVKAGGGTK